MIRCSKLSSTDAWGEESLHMPHFSFLLDGIQTFSRSLRVLSEDGGLVTIMTAQQASGITCSSGTYAIFDSPHNTPPQVDKSAYGNGIEVSAWVCTYADTPMPLFTVLQERWRGLFFPQYYAHERECYFYPLYLIDTDVQMYLCPVDLYIRNSDQRILARVISIQWIRRIFGNDQRDDKNKPKPEKKKPAPKPEKKKPVPRKGGREPREPREPNATFVWG